ncbi:MAG: hypothetical protein CSA81_05195 [Acidobacteria bacterium]|nr:MAG: hypothetical protein CSA81_05195 [Acidobacteriota bacterium]
MKKIMMIFAISLFLLPLSAFAEGEEGLFVRKGCNKCHSLEKFNIERKKAGEDQGPDLSKVGAEYDKEWLTKWLKKKVTKKNKDGEMAKHSNSWKGSASQLKKMVEFLATLK